MPTAMIFFLSMLSTAPVQAADAPTQTLFVPLEDVALHLDVEPEGADREPLAWSTLGGWSVGDDYPLHDASGAVILRCAVQSFELRAPEEGALPADWAQGGTEVWAALACPLDVVAGL